MAPIPRRPVALASLLLTALTGCGLRPEAADATKQPIAVVAAENVWGGIVAALGGDQVRVTSIVTNPAVDPHEYEATAADARHVAAAAYVVSNGAGYDAWLDRLAAANPVPGRPTLVVASLLGRQAGDNPHFWYSPAAVQRVAARVSADLARLRPTAAPYLRARAEAFRAGVLQPYLEAVASTRQRFRGVPVGATESVFVYLAEALGLDLVTPPAYMKAVSDGSEPAVADKVAVEAQVRTHRLRALVFNPQNSTPAVNSLVARARADGIPVVAMTETPVPASAGYGQWQGAQLRALAEALGG